MDTLLVWLKMRLDRIIEGKAVASEIAATLLIMLLCLPILFVCWVYFIVVYYYQVLRGKRLERRRKQLDTFLASVYKDKDVV